MAVVVLRPEQGPPAAVLKVARGPLRATQLRTQRRVLAELAIHQGLNEEWREVLPRILAFDERTDATVSVESYRPGIDLAEVLARHPDRVRGADRRGPERHSAAASADCYVRHRRQRLLVAAMGHRTIGGPGRTCAGGSIPAWFPRWTGSERCYGRPLLAGVCR